MASYVEIQPSIIFILGTGSEVFSWPMHGSPSKLTVKCIMDYAAKPEHYFSGARKNFVDSLPVNPNARLLEVGCGNGDTGAYALATQKCGWCAGVELWPDAAREASKRISEVLVGDVEQIALPWSPESFDVLVMSEVPEHLRDPWATLRRLHRFLKPGALVVSGSPNVAHHSVLRMLIRGRWNYQATGLMDWTHLRWFTPATYREMFQICGYKVIEVKPAARLRWKSQWFNLLTFRKLEHLLHTQIVLRAIRASLDVHGDLGFGNSRL